MIGAEYGRVFNEHQILIGTQCTAGWKIKADISLYFPVRKIDRCGPAIIKLDPLLIRFRIMIGSHMGLAVIHHLIDDHVLIHREKIRAARGCGNRPLPFRSIYSPQRIFHRARIGDRHLARPVQKQRLFILHRESQLRL